MEMISTSEIRISVVVPRHRPSTTAVRAVVHDAFELGSTDERGRGLRRYRTMSAALGSRFAGRTGGLRIGVVGATGQVGTVMRTPARRARLPGGRDPLLRLGPFGRQHPDRGKASGRPSSRTPMVADPSGLDIALFSAGGSTSKELVTEVRGGRRHRHRQLLVRGASDPDVPLVVSEVNPGVRGAQRAQGHHREPELHHHGRDAGAQAAARRSRCAHPADRVDDLPSGIRCRSGRRRRARQARCARWSTATSPTSPSRRRRP